MAALLNIKQGGKIRFNLPIVAGQTWSKGQAIVINSAGALELYAGQPTVLLGLALEDCIAASPGNVMLDTSTVVTGNTGGILLGEAVVETDNLSGTGGWTPGASAVYAQSGGNVSYNSASGLSIGKAIGNPVNNGRLTFLFRPPIA